MLHFQLAQTWPSWHEYLRNVQIIILDEAHVYSGAFGANFVNILRRSVSTFSSYKIRLMNAIYELQGSPSLVRFIIATATVSNPMEMALLLAQKPLSQFHWVKNSGSAIPLRCTIVMKPSDKMIEDAAAICSLWVEHNLQGIAFCNTLDTMNELMAYINSVIWPI